MAEFKLRFISDNWVARPQFRLGDMRVPSGVFWYRNWFAITTFPLYNSATYLKTAEFKLRFEDGNEVTRSQFRLGEMT